jgi:hypothetical protein
MFSEYRPSEFTCSDVKTKLERMKVLHEYELMQAINKVLASVQGSVLINAFDAWIERVRRGIANDRDCVISQTNSSNVMLVVVRLLGLAQKFMYYPMVQGYQKVVSTLPDFAGSSTFFKSRLII